MHTKIMCLALEFQIAVDVQLLKFLGDRYSETRTSVFEFLW
jgi:hypothetical protein